MSDPAPTLRTLQAIAVGAAVGTAIGRLLGIGPVGTALGFVAGTTAGALVASATAPTSFQALK